MKHPKDANYAFKHCGQNRGRYYIGRRLELRDNPMRTLKFLKGKHFANAAVAIRREMESKVVEESTRGANDTR